MTFAQPAWLLLFPALLLAWALIWRRSPRSRWLRLVFIVLATLAAAGPRLLGSAARPVVVLLVDRSASVRGEALARARELAVELSDALGRDGGELHVIGFGQGAQLLAAAGESLEQLEHPAAQDASDLAAALRLAAARMPKHARGEILLVSDGLYTGDDPRSSAAELHRRGIRLTHVDVGVRAVDDVAITRLVAPQRVPVGQRFSVAVELDSPRTQAARLRVHDAAGVLLADEAVELPAGTRRYSIALAADVAGVQTLIASVQPTQDSRPENNRARAVVEIAGRPRVIVYNASAAQSALVRALASAELDVQVRDARTPLTLASLHGVVAVALENMPLGELGDEADRALETYVRELGGGLLITGGRSSYSAGGYYRSRIEALLPVSMDRREELRRPRLDLGIAMDRSGSMAAEADNGVIKMDLANRAAGEAIKLLAPGDGVTVLAVDSSAHVVVQLQRLSDPVQLHSVLEKVLRIEPGGGGILVGVALAVTMDQLLKSDAASRHIVLLADAADAEEPGNYRELIERWTSAGGTLSVVGLGEPHDADAGLLQMIAALGGGHVYFTADALQLPRVFAQDVMHVARTTFLDRPAHVAAAPGLLSLQVESKAIPDVGGYNLTYLADHAEAMLVSDDDQHAPLAAGKQAGAGKVFAATFEADGVFTGPFADWSEYKAFLRGALEWIKRPESSSDFAASIQLEGDRAVVSLELAPGQQLTAAPEVLLEAPRAASAQRARLEWTSPSTLAATVPIPTSAVYQGVVRIPGHAPIPLAPVVMPYSPELAIRAAGQAGSEVLAQVARATGGGPLTRIEDVLQRSAGPVHGERDLTPWLAAVLLAILLLDVAHRRALLDRTLAKSRARLMPLRRKPRAVEPTPQLAAANTVELPAPVPAIEEQDPFIAAKKRARRRQRL